MDLRLKRRLMGVITITALIMGLSYALRQLKAVPILGPDGKPSGKTWADMWVDEINHYHVRDLLAPYDSPGTKLRWIGSCGAMFKGAEEWNRLGNVIPFKIRLPSYNPFKEWRGMMKSSEKDEQPDMRVLEPEEWYHFREFLPAKTRAICELALMRFMSLADIRAYANKGHGEGDLMRERRQKSGELYVVPFLIGSPQRYDFTDFVGSFRRAQVKSGMDHPVGHPKHFSPKTLRKSGATWAWRETRDLVTISQMLGHKKITTTQRYLGIKEGDIRTVAAAVDRIANAKFGGADKATSMTIRWGYGGADTKKDMVFQESGIPFVNHGK